MGMMRRILRLLLPYRGMVILSFILQLFIIATRLLQPMVTMMVVNDVIMQGQHDRLLSLCLMLLGLALTRVVCSFFRVNLLEQASQNVAFDLRSGMFRHLQHMSSRFFDQNRVGEIMSRMTGDLEGVRDYLANGPITVFEQTITFIGSLIFMFILSWQIALTILLVLPLIALLAFRFRRKVRPLFRQVREQQAVLNTRVQENITGIHVVKAFVREEYESSLLEAENRKLLKLNLDVTWAWTNYVPFIQWLSELCTPLVLAVGALMMANGQMSLGALVGVTGYIWMLTQPMRMLSQMINAATQASTSAEKVFYYLDLGSSIKDKPGTTAPVSPKGSVVFDQVSFSYGGQPVLRDISFSVEPGQTVAIIGPTGSGKSTLMRLLGRFYEVGSGRILVDGKDLREQPMKDLRSHIGYVPQETFLFSDSLLENIRFGQPDAAMDQVVGAARSAQAEPFINEMPLGYETVVGERGVGLSGGQKQRTAIARALLIQPNILVLDDATSAVDMQTEHQIQQALENTTRNITTFIIAHRISSVKNADLILVLSEGRIIQRGTHQELLEQKGEYHQMWLDQLASIVGEGGVA